MMKKRHILHWAMGVVMTPLLGSCAADDIGDAGREGCDIILGQPITVTSVTRSTDGSKSSTQFEQDEIVWLWALKDGTTNEHITAWKLKANGSGGFSSSTTGAAKYWPSDGTKLNVYALHGNFTNSPSITEGTTKWSTLSLTHTVESDQSSDVNKRLSDLLYSQTSSAVAPNTGSVQLTFNHLLAKITVKLDLSNSKGITASELSNASVKLTNILPEATFTSSTGAAASAGGDRTAITAGKPTSVSDGAVIGSAIVPLQDFGATNNNKITIKLSDTRSFSYTPADVTLGKGNEYIYTLKIINGELSVSSISVRDFTNESTQEKKWDIYVEPSGS